MGCLAGTVNCALRPCAGLWLWVSESWAGSVACSSLLAKRDASRLGCLAVTRVRRGTDRRRGLFSQASASPTRVLPTCTALRRAGSAQTGGTRSWAPPGAAARARPVRRAAARPGRRSGAAPPGPGPRTDCTCRHQAAISDQPGADSEPPNSCTDSAAVRPAKASRSASGQPASVPVTNPATNTSPAPVGSRASTAMAGTSRGLAGAPVHRVRALRAERDHRERYPFGEGAGGGARGSRCGCSASPPRRWAGTPRSAPGRRGPPGPSGRCRPSRRRRRSGLPVPAASAIQAGALAGRERGDGGTRRGGRAAGRGLLRAAARGRGRPSCAPPRTPWRR